MVQATGVGIEVPSDIAFAAAYGAACVKASHLHYRLAYLYSVTFDDRRSASRPRVAEKFNEAFGPDMTIGRLWGLVRDRQRGPLRMTVDCAVRLRNYLVHFFIWDTRGQQGDESGLEALAQRLNVARDYLTAAGQALHERHCELLIEAGADPDVVDQHSKPWDELGATTARPVRLPATSERIVRAWSAPNENGGAWVYFENGEGEFWQLSEKGLSECQHETRGADWIEWSAIQVHLPADVTARPSKKSNPREWRSEFNYDLRFSTGVVLTLELHPAAGTVTWEVRAENVRTNDKVPPDVS